MVGIGHFAAGRGAAALLPVPGQDVAGDREEVGLFILDKASGLAGLQTDKHLLNEIFNLLTGNAALKKNGEQPAERRWVRLTSEPADPMTFSLQSITGRYHRAHPLVI